MHATDRALRLYYAALSTIAAVNLTSRDNVMENAHPAELRILDTVPAASLPRHVCRFEFKANQQKVRPYTIL